MNVLIATAGVLPPGPVADFVELLAAPPGKVTVMNVTQAPAEFLDELEDDSWQPFDAPASRSDPDRATREADRYIQERGSKIVAPVVAALKLRDVVTATLFVEAEDVAQAIIDTAERIGADAIVMGATRRLFNEMSWTSVSMTVVARASLPVLLIPEPAQPDN
ncbi:universal stress protein [Candidatus Spongiisocius sp.]|uniref:universal stress protein n=1 Tax=Candidatus Spongiisocius sp. TaxID=3101273 RepID=UPI003B5C5B71